MKRRYQAGILAAALSLTMMTTAFANVSSSTGMAGSSNVGDRPNKIEASVPGGSRNSGAMSGQSREGSTLKFTDNFIKSSKYNQIAQVNEGLANIQSLTSDLDLTGYNPLVRFQELQTESKPSAANPVKFDIYVPNLVGNLNNVQILIMNTETGKWELVAPAGIDPVTKMVSVSLTFTGPMTVVYKN